MQNSIWLPKATCSFIVGFNGFFYDEYDDNDYNDDNDDEKVGW